MFRVQDDALRFGPPPNTAQLNLDRRVGEAKQPTPPPPSNIDDRYFSSAPSTSAAEFRRNMLPPSWNSNTSATPPSESDDDDDDEDDDEDDDYDDHDDNSNQAIKINDNNNISEKIGKTKLQAAFGRVSNSRMVNNLNNGGMVTVADQQQQDGEMYYSQYLHAAVVEGSNDGGGANSSSGHKDLMLENGCGFSGRKDASLFSTESLREILSDPITGALMDDAAILPCGHSFGGGGIQHVIRMKACYTCSQPVSEDSIAPNLSLRTAVQAFRREDESRVYRPSKKRKERFDQEKGSFGDSSIDRVRGVQFPFAVTDRVIIKGNKRTPERFVGREAIVTTQCLNGWYVVKTLDNAESVKLQYRSLAKVSDDLSNAIPSKMAPSWLQQ
ncbi:hypothetical protein ACFE04_019143 [Oxalis oulophora]